jgi:hypothetical protein
MNSDKSTSRFRVDGMVLREQQVPVSLAAYNILEQVDRAGFTKE